MFDWNDLKFFLELARQGRLMPAARRLKVDHTTVSRRISELERDLGIKIFDRKPNGFVLTEDGHKLYQEAEKIEGAALVISEDFRATPTEPTGRVRLTSMEGIAAFYLAEKLVQFNEKHPGVVVELVTERHLINLTKREADEHQLRSPRRPQTFGQESWRVQAWPVRIVQVHRGTGDAGHH